MPPGHAVGEVQALHNGDGHHKVREQDAVRAREARAGGGSSTCGRHGWQQHPTEEMTQPLSNLPTRHLFGVDGGGTCGLSRQAATDSSRWAYAQASPASLSTGGGWRVPATPGHSKSAQQLTRNSHQNTEDWQC